jgi:phage-related protein
LISLAVLAATDLGVCVERRWRYYRTSLGRETVREELRALGLHARAAVTEAMKRHVRGELMRYEDEHLGGDLRAIRVFLDGNTYRLLYAYEGKRDQVFLALHCKERPQATQAGTKPRIETSEGLAQP